MLIRFKNYHFLYQDTIPAEADEHDYTYELVDSDRIVHVYEVMPEREAICVEYINYKEDPRKIYEYCGDKFRTSARVFEIERILKGETKS